MNARQSKSPQEPLRFAFLLLLLFLLATSATITMLAVRKSPAVVYEDF